MLVARYHAAASVPSAMRITLGTSASLRNQSFPETTVLGSDQVVPVRSANFSVASASCCSTQLKIVPRVEVVSCGSEASAGAGSGSGATVKAVAGGVEFAAALCSAGFGLL